MSDFNLQTIIDIQNAKEAFGTLAVLDDVEIQDMPAVLDFAKVVSNYMKISRLSVKHNL